MIYQSSFQVATQGRGVYPIKRDVDERLKASAIQTGIGLVFLHQQAADLLVTVSAFLGVLCISLMGIMAKRASSLYSRPMCWNSPYRVMRAFKEISCLLTVTFLGAKLRIRPF